MAPKLMIVTYAEFWRNAVSFGVISRAMDSDGLVREIRSVMTGNGSILYWREI